MKSIAVITMARNDEFFLNRWAAYYGPIFGPENLYVYLDGADQKWKGPAKVNVTAVPKLGIKVVDAERQRLDFLSDRAAELFARGYDIVIGVDADEFLVLDPRVKESLPLYLSRTNATSPLGLDFAERPGEGAFDGGRPFLAQRRFALIHSRFTKASIMRRPGRWGRGFHRVRGRNFAIDPNLYLLHFGNYSRDAVLAKMNHPDIIARNEVKHYRRNRLRIFNVVSAARVRDFERATRMARIIQTLARSPFAWNKPAMLGLEPVVRMPERFKRIKL